MVEGQINRIVEIRKEKKKKKKKKRKGGNKKKRRFKENKVEVVTEVMTRHYIARYLQENFSAG